MKKGSAHHHSTPAKGFHHGHHAHHGGLQKHGGMHHGGKTLVATPSNVKHLGGKAGK
jgi:hypothetical protein